MNSAERVARVMAATVHYIHPDLPEADHDLPLIDPTQEVYMSRERWETLVRRILAAADGVEEFTTQVVYKPAAGTQRRRSPNLEARNAYEADKRERRKHG